MGKRGKFKRSQTQVITVKIMRQLSNLKGLIGVRLSLVSTVCKCPRSVAAFGRTSVQWLIQFSYCLVQIVWASARGCHCPEPTRNCEIEDSSARSVLEPSQVLKRMLKVSIM